MKQITMPMVLLVALTTFNCFYIDCIIFYAIFILNKSLWWLVLIFLQGYGSCVYIYKLLGLKMG